MAGIVLDVLYVFPAVLLEFVEGHCLPVNRECLPLLHVAECRNLEWEQIESATHTQVFLLVKFLWFACFLVVLKRVEVVQELAIKAANNHDLIGSNLAHARTLSCRNERGILYLLNVNSFPLIFVRVVNIVMESFNRR